jgi:GTP-binding protein
LVRQAVARTSGAPGKTRLANVYRVGRGAWTPFYLVDLPGYGYARGGTDAARAFEVLARAYFERVRPSGSPGLAALLLVDARHPGLASDRAAWQWIRTAAERVAVVATKVDTLARGERIRSLRELESVFEDSVLPFSAVTGEGLDELWTLIDRLLNNRTPPRSRSRQPRPPVPPRPPRLPRKS